MYEDTGFREFLVNRRVSAPLAGDGLFVTEDALRLNAGRR
jgi:hypothetical protein